MRSRVTSTESSPGAPASRRRVALVALLAATALLAPAALPLPLLAPVPRPIVLNLAGLLVLSWVVLLRDDARCRERRAARDSGERLRAETALRESERKHHLHALGMPLGLIEWTPTFEVRQWNPAAERIFGIAARDAIGRHARDLIMTEANTDQVDEAWRRLLHLRERVQSRARHERPGGQELYCDWFSTPLIDETDELIGVTSLVHDVTEHVATLREKEILERRLRRSQRTEAMGTLAGGIAHDFNNILFSAMGFTEIALGQVPPDSRAADCLRQTLQAHSRAADLIDRILAFGRRDDTPPEPLRFDRVIRDELKLLRASLPAAIDIQVDLDRGSGRVEAAEVQIHQILMNLCSNAAHAMGAAGGRLSIELATVPAGELEPSVAPAPSASSYLRLDVSDTGGGMSRATRERIFTPYFTTKRIGEGTGLGLATVHGLVETLGGAITVRSRVGRGSRFSIYLPRIEETETPEAAADDTPDAEERPPAERRRVLFIDDEPQVVSFAGYALSDLGWKVDAFRNPVPALDAFRADPARYDLVITDQTMPGLTGAEIVKTMLEIRPDVPIILCSGSGASLDRRAALDLGVAEFLSKPFRLATLRRTLDRALETRPRPPADDREREALTCSAS